MARQYESDEIDLLIEAFGGDADDWDDFYLRDNEDIFQDNYKYADPDTYGDKDQGGRSGMSYNGDIYFDGNSGYDDDYSDYFNADKSLNLGTADWADVKHFYHEGGHQKQRSMFPTGSAGDEAWKDLLRTSYSSEDYNYSKIFDPNVDFYELNAEQQAQFLRNITLLRKLDQLGGSIDQSLKAALEADLMKLPDKHGGDITPKTLAQHEAVMPADLDAQLQRSIKHWQDNSDKGTVNSDNGVRIAGENDDGSTDSDSSDTDSYADDVCVLYGVAESNASPLVLDLDGDGVELISLASADAVYWDIDSSKNDGVAEASGWVSADDALLALDVNSDGNINNSSELFGDQTGFANGFLALKAYDDNLDGVINAEDSIWSDLVVWQDSSGDAISEEEELYTLDELNITEINLTYSDVSITNAGNTIKQQGSFVIGGSTNIIADVYFTYSNSNTINVSDYSFDLAATVHPKLRGYGNIKDFHVAISMDNDTGSSDSLLSLLNDFDDLTLVQIFTDDTTVLDDIVDIMYRWAGVDGVDPSSRGPSIDARTLKFLENFTGEDFLQRGWLSNPGSWAAVDLEEAFHIAHQNITARLIAQGAGGDLFTGDVYYNVVADNLDGVTGLNHDTIDDLETLGLSMTSPEVFWANIVRVVEFTVGTANLSTGDADYLEDAIQSALPTTSLQDIVDSLDFSAPDGVSVGGTSGDDTLTGGVGDDTLSGSYGNDELDGGLGNDTLYGGTGADVLTGGAGSDYVLGDSGDDRYVYNVGHGHDVYGESGSGTDDRIVFGAGITLNDLTISRVGNTDLLIEIDNGTYTGSIVIENQFNYSPGGDHIELLEFADASTYRLDDKNYTQIGSAGDDYLVGTAAGGLDADTIYGGDGNDTIYGGAPNQNDYEINTLYGEAGADKLYGDRGDDIVDGGSGNDYLYGDGGADELTGGTGDDIIHGAGGADTYYYNLGDGNDTYQEYSSDADKIVFGAGISQQDLTFSRFGNHNVLIEIAGGGSIMIERQTNAGTPIETLEFADSSTLDMTALDVTTYGTSGNDSLSGVTPGDGASGVDTIYAGDGDDTVYVKGGNAYEYIANTIYGEGGNDDLYGDRGNDIIDGGEGDDYINANSGDDVLTGGLGDDYIYGGHGSDIYYYNLGDGNDTYQDDGTDADKIVFGAGITQQDLTITRESYYNVRIEIDPGIGGGSILIERQTNASDYIATLEFADSSTLDLTTYDITTYGTSAGETISGVTPGNGASGVDTIYAGDGDDTVNAKGSTSYEYLANTLYGEGGNDILRGNRGDDAVYGGTGTDTIYGDAGNDILDGGTGDDVIYGGSGADAYYYNLGDGNDTYQDSNSASDRIVFGAGITFEDLTITKDAYYNVLIEIDPGIGGGSILINRQTNTADFIETLEFADSSTVDFNTIDLVTYGTSAGENIIGARPDYGASGVDTIYAGDGDDTVYAKGTNSYEYLENWLYGEGGDDTLYGDRGNDTLSGGIGDDYLRDTNGGDDTLIYESGLDRVYNIHGNDTLIIDNSYTINDVAFTDTGSHHDWVFDSGVDELRIEWADSGANYVIEKVIFNSDGFEANNVTNAENWIWGTDMYDFTTGTTGDDVAIGRDGDDDLSGNAGDDAIHGGSGADMIDGGADDDFLHGGTGDDEIYGGAGNDIMFGGDDADTFIFESGTTSGYVDTIKDFSTTDGDALDIADLLTGYDPMTDLITDFVQITDDGTDSILAVDADGGADNFVQIVSLLDVTGLTDEVALESVGTLITV